MKVAAWRKVVGIVFVVVLMSAVSRAQAPAAPPAARAIPPEDRPQPLVAEHPALFLVGDSIMHTGTGGCGAGEWSAVHRSEYHLGQ